ncbi:MAG: hypothetical protein QOF76_1812 [Solirubrobacteraceae bacterium]|jgi:hypothetical protein|nr:hypothetical protein [Solirubrobacteraceae bacterium]
MSDEHDSIGIPDDGPPDVRDRFDRVIARLDAFSPYWTANLVVLVGLALYLSLYPHMQIKNQWALPLAEGVMFVGLLVVRPRIEAGTATHRRHIVFWLLVGLSVVTVGCLTFLNHRLLTHHAPSGSNAGHDLILTGAVLWSTNVLMFALWYWEIDRGGPVQRLIRIEREPDFLFPQMTDPEFAVADWRPRMVDYLYLSLTSAMAFSPTDALPMTPLAKILMGAQALISLSTVGLVIARAVNILS